MTTNPVEPACLVARPPEPAEPADADEPNAIAVFIGRLTMGSHKWGIPEGKAHCWWRLSKSDATAEQRPGIYCLDCWTRVDQPEARAACDGTRHDCPACGAFEGLSLRFNGRGDDGTARYYPSHSKPHCTAFEAFFASLG